MDASRRKTPQKKKKKKKKPSMASRSSVVSEDQLLCPICLDVFVQPATTPCGHNFCRSCLSSYWDKNPATCPVCKELFLHKPDLKVNTCISDLVQQFHSLHASPEIEAKPDVFCDICTELQNGAVKSCVECMASYCELHLEPHHRVPGLKRHKLIQPLANLDHQICREHNQLLTLFCKNEKVLLCTICASLHDVTHNTVHLQKAYEDIKATLEHEEIRVHAVIQDKSQKAASFSKSIQQEQHDTKNVITNSVEALNAVISKLQKTHADLVKNLEDEQKERSEEIEFIVKHIQEDVASFKVTESKIKQLKEIEDPLDFLQTYSSLTPVSSSGVVSISHKALQETRKAVCTSLQTLMDKIDEEIVMVPDYLVNVQKYQFGMYLNPETAHHCLELSSDFLEVRYDTWMLFETISPSPRRFTSHFFVLSATCIVEQGYFEVFVGEKSEWILGVAAESVQRKGLIPKVPGCGIWALYFRQNRFETFCCPGKTICIGKVERVGVYVHCKAGKVSFYDVKNAMLLHSFTGCNLPDILLAILNPCNNELGNNLGAMKFVKVNQE